MVAAAPWRHAAAVATASRIMGNTDSPTINTTSTPMMLRTSMFPLATQTHPLFVFHECARRATAPPTLAQGADVKVNSGN